VCEVGDSEATNVVCLKAVVDGVGKLSLQLNYIMIVPSSQPLLCAKIC
jgi:hypothetical protein